MMVALGCPVADIGKAPTKRFNKNKDGLFMDMNSLEGKW
jgi:hypothetical protein